MFVKSNNENKKTRNSSNNSASGTVGSEVVKQISRDAPNINIKAAVHSVGNLKKVKDDRVESVQIDYNKPETLAAALKGIDKHFLVLKQANKRPEFTSSLGYHKY